MKIKNLGLATIAIVWLMTLSIGTGAAQNDATKDPSSIKPPFYITPAEAREIEKNNALSITKFYDTPQPLKGEPGKLIRAQEFFGYNLPGDWNPEDMGIKTVRFLYLSKSVEGKVVPASGVILIPYGKPPAKGWPVIVWAHGTSGVGRPCAPSLMKDLYYGWQGLLQWPMLGYAVVAPDYAGLGTDVPHQYLVAPAQAQDVLNSVPAAREAVPQLGSRWVAVGHSQGAAAVLFAAELLNQKKVRDPGYLGAVALSPGTDRIQLLRSATKNRASHGYLAFQAYAMKKIFPDFQYSHFLTPEAIKLMPVVETGAWYVSLATFAHKIPVGKMLLPNAEKNPHFLKFRDMSIIGLKRAHGPIFLAQGLEDKTIPSETVQAAYKRMIAQGSTVEYKEYPGLSHDGLVFGSFRDQLRWVQDRFAGKPVSTKKEGK